MATAFAPPVSNALDGVVDTLRLTQAEIARAAGLPRETLARKERLHSPSAQARLRLLADILTRASAWTGGPLAAFAWYRSQPLPSFGDMTAEDLVRAGRGEAVRDYLSRIAVGGYA
ncbi:antitoxin Xre/MbcA/ParS toxin-binding domain-containing protein [Sandaracinobacteroides saxicola]|uniref:DUF2384 domain-containing protein n=1 Tax=Sandaracinobacteroides saxicola TaxID=2759707 RepID=A0A7G5IGW5_9SPHN|nr:antitoxin Xre/MbcA/ParS toxin-binding domain-containing protein [Sandaracinobacteroides saxicola]QMW22607.1 DUF2384 domain-containing protein [Sandaracinobacteroides saxicola]